MLAHAITHESGATLFNLSPRSTDGKFQGKDASLMVHMVCLAHSSFIMLDKKPLQ
jgi:hypothetical protein